MSKTNFVNGTIVEPEFLNAIFSHSHDADNSDGHCPKINLTEAAEVTGTLPLANQATHIHDGNQRPKIVLTDADHVSGVLPLANQASHIHDGSERSKVDPDLHIYGVTHASCGMSFNGYENGTTEMCYVKFRKFSSSIGFFPVVQLYFSNAFGTSNQNYLNSPAVLPSDVLPAVDYISQPIYLLDNTIPKLGCCRLSNDGSITFLLCEVNGSHIQLNANGFTSSGTKGYYSFLMSYPIYPVS